MGCSQAALMESETLNTATETQPSVLSYWPINHRLTVRCFSRHRVCEHLVPTTGKVRKLGRVCCGKYLSVVHSFSSFSLPPQPTSFASSSRASVKPGNALRLRGKS